MFDELGRKGQEREREREREGERERESERERETESTIFIGTLRSGTA